MYPIQGIFEVSENKQVLEILSQPSNYNNRYIYTRLNALSNYSTYAKG